MQKTLPFEINEQENIGFIKVSNAFFERDCVLTVIGKYTDEYWATIHPVNPQEIEISLSLKDGSQIEEDTLKTVLNDFIEYQLKLDMVKEFVSSSN